MRNALRDLRWGRPLNSGWNRPGAGSDPHQNTDHLALDRIFPGRVRPGDVMVDIGCGRGRVLAYWLSNFPGHRVVGIEIDAELAAGTGRRLARHEDCTVLHGDAIELLPTDASLIYLYNPFGAGPLARLERVLRQRASDVPTLQILYHHPKHLEVFAEDAVWTVERVGLGGGRLAPLDDLAVITPRR